MSDSATPWTAACQVSCPSLSPAVCSNSWPLIQWCHPNILSPLGPFSSCPQSFPASGSFSVSWLFLPCGQSIGSSTSASVFQMNIQGWFPLGLTCLIALLSKRLQESSPALQFESFSSLALCLLYGPSFTYMYDYWKNRGLTTGKTIGLTIQTFVSKVMSLLLNTVSVCHSFPSKEQVSFNFMATVTICRDFGG